MTMQEPSVTFDASILVLHPLSAPQVFNAEGALEFEEEGALVLPVQKQLKDAMVRVLSEFAEFRKTPAIAVESRLRVESQDESEFPATHVVRLVGVGVTSAEVMVFRAAAQVILSSLVPQRSLAEPDMGSSLQENEKCFLRELGDGIAAKFAGKSITQGFVVKFGNADLHGVSVQGSMPALALEQGASGTLEGVGKPLGFNEEKSTAILWFTGAANDDGLSLGRERLEVLCHNLDFLRTLAHAYANRNLVKFKAIRQPEARKKRSVITLLELSEVAANNPDQFQLE
jgi:hypothetical protein